MEFLCLFLALSLLLPLSLIFLGVVTFTLIICFLVDITLLAVVAEIVILVLVVGVLVYHRVLTTGISDAVTSCAKLLATLGFSYHSSLLFGVLLCRLLSFTLLLYHLHACKLILRSFPIIFDHSFFMFRFISKFFIRDACSHRFILSRRSPQAWRHIIVIFE